MSFPCDARAVGVTRRTARLAGALATLALALACDPAESATPAHSRQQAQQPQQPASTAGQPTFVAHDEHIQPGLAIQRPLALLRNPYEGNTAAAADGAKLFVAYNCIDCHGADGAGAMGPSLADGRWHFGGSAGEVFQSVYEGRPEGMPAWGGRIADDQIWRLVAYVRSLGAGKDVTTEDFRGREVERTGH